MTQASLITEILHPFGKGTLTTDGVQYCTEKVTSTDDYETVEEVTMTVPQSSPLEEIEFGLTAGFRSSSTAENVLYKWQIKDTSETSYDTLVAETTLTTPGVTSLERTWSGRKGAGTYFTATKSFNVRLQIKSGSAGGETAKGKTKSSSYIMTKYRHV